MNIEDLTWIDTELLTASTRLPAKIHVCKDRWDCNEFQEMLNDKSVKSGGGIFRHLTKPDRVLIKDHPSKIPMYKYGKTVDELWHVPNCTFSDLFESARSHFGFPSEIAEDPKAAYNATKEIVFSLHRDGLISFSHIGEYLIEFRIAAGKKLIRPCAKTIYQNNRQYFGVKTSKFEENDQIGAWIKFGFFTIGGI